MFTDKAQAIIDLAKDCAYARMKEELDVESLLAAVGGDVEAGVRLAECLMHGDVAALRTRCPELGQPASCPGKMGLSPAFRELLGAAIALASAEGVPDPHHPGLVDIRHLVCAIAVSREACRLLGNLTPILREDAVRLLTAWYQDAGTPLSIGELVERLRGLRTELLRRVFGQDHAVHAFVEGLYNAELTAAADRERKRPSAVFVFAGPAGVGKTYISELCAAYLGRPFKRFDMTSYSDHQAHNQLVGFGPSYQGAHAGLLTGFVEKNPTAFLLFDEIEKAHIHTIQLFYQILDAGRLEDKFTERDVSFRDTVIIFTTNAGRSLYEHPNRMGISAANSGYHRRTILSALEHEQNPLTGQATFPPAICSRLAQGYPVMFNYLGVNELERVSAAEMARTEALLERQYYKRFNHDPLLPISLVLREGGRVDARQLRAETEKFVKTEVFKFASLYAKSKLDEALAQVDQVRFAIEGTPQDWDAEVRLLYEPPGKPKVLLLCNAGFASLCREHVPEVQWHSAATPDEAIDVLSTEDIDVVLLDLWIRREVPQPGRVSTDSGSFSSQDYMALSSRTLDEGRGLLRRIHERFPDAPIYLLSFVSGDVRDQESPTGGHATETIRIDGTHADAYAPVLGGSRRRAIDDELFLACVRAGGARGLVATDFLEVQSDDWQARKARFVETLIEITRRLYREKKAHELAQARQVLLFDTTATLDKKRRELTIQIRELHLGRAIDAADAGELVDDVQRPTTRFEDVLGAAGAKDALQFIVDWLSNPKHYAAMGIRPPKGILLSGPPGTGKTMLARAVAGESNCAFVEKSATSFVTIWQGSGPQNVRNLFERARRYAPSVVFIDEIDAIGSRRSGSAGAGRAEEETLNAILTEMDGFNAPTMQPVIVLAATNMPRLLDEALKRRFDRVIEVDRPDREARLKYLEKSVLQRKAVRVTREAVERLAGQTAGMTIADLERVVHEAAVMAARKGTPMTVEILDEAFDKIRMGEAKGPPDKATLQRVARHEAGHAVIAWLGGNLPVQVTIVGRGGAGGYMERESDESRMLFTKPELEQRIREAMGGRAAEIVYYGQDEGLSTGVASDLEQATVWAMRMVREFGMTEALGQVALADDGYARPLDGPLAAKVMEAAEQIVKQQLSRAVAQLEANRPALDRLSGELLEKNRLTREELVKILPSGPARGPQP